MTICFHRSRFIFNELYNFIPFLLFSRTCIFVCIFVYISRILKSLVNFCFLLSDPQRDHMNLFSNRQQPKKKRKSRTAFTNHQIFELEKRFLYQKYLSPADRDEIAQSLGLTNAQVITWFQNRRAKLKRDMEELKKDVESAKVTERRNILDSLQDINSISKHNMNKSSDL